MSKRGAFLFCAISLAASAVYAKDDGRIGCVFANNENETTPNNVARGCPENR